MIKQGKVILKNDIGTELLVKVCQNECPGDPDYLDIEVVVDPDGYGFYFHSEQEFKDWILQLQKTFLQEHDVDKFPSERVKLRAALDAVEYVPNAGEGMDGFSRCPWCDAFSDEPHADDCAREVALGKQVKREAT